MSVRREQEQPSQSWIVRHLGREIKAWREQAGMTQAELAGKTHVSSKTVSAIESGRRPPSASFIKLADIALDARGSLVRLWREMTDGLYPGWFRHYVGLESVATGVRQFEPQLVPGLVQTEAYMRALFAAAQPPMSADEIDEQVAARLARQEILTKADAPNVWLILDEAVLRRWPPVPGVAREQLEHLLSVGERPNVTIQVVPFEAGVHAGMHGFMALLSFNDAEDCAYVEPACGGVIVTDAPTVATLQHRYDLLRADALSPAESAQMIRKILETL
ncbi:MAG: helix-turn-helix transcriptional regulator [Streptomycetaceae bacterium]|nr:helix-turn-helix transcriptional regulator [Streptomycetaceae bacterium]